MKPLVVVTGATGAIGGGVAEGLLQRGVRVRALGRDPARLAALAAMGAEPRSGMMEDAAFLEAALRGADAVFAMIPENPAAPDIHADKRPRAESLTAALRAAGVPRVVVLSAIGVTPPTGIGPSRALGEFEALIASVPGLSTVTLRAAFLMENLLGSIPLIRAAGIHGSPMRGDVPLAMVAKRDVADAAAELLAAPGSDGDTVRPLLGPRDYTWAEATAVLGRVIGQPDLPYLQLPSDDFRSGIIASGASPSMAEALLELFAALDAGRIQALTTRDAAATTPTSLETFAREIFAPAFGPLPAFGSA